MKVRIVNDSGIGRFISVVNAETGEKIEGVYKVEITAEMNSTVEAKVYLRGVKVDIISESLTIQNEEVQDEKTEDWKEKIIKKGEKSNE